MSEPAAIPWEPWGEAAFARARAEGKPVLLHIGATWCHWCHVMDEGSYTWPGVAELIRAHFVAVRVDTDERPDVNERYNQGGWPTFAVLDAEGEVLMGRTYVPGHELGALLAGLAESDARWSLAPPRPPAPAAEPPPVEAVLAEVTRAYDRWHGGFGDVEKFPHPAVCGWLLDRRLRGQDDAGMLATTLHAMVGGGLYDHEEGGFFRYATQDDWAVPHYEKMLEDHARLLDVYLRADAAWPDPGWRAATEGALAWALRVLWSPDGFGGSQDADEAYYTHALALRADPPAVDRTVYAGWNGLMVVALVRAWAAWDRPGLLGVARGIGRVLLGRVDAEGRVRRAGQVWGLLEDQVQVAAALQVLHVATGEEGWLPAAERCLRWGRTHLAAADGGVLDRVPEGVGRLKHPRRSVAGNAAWAEACLRHAALTGDEAWSTDARAAARAALCEGAEWGLLAATAAAAAERVERGLVVVKVNGSDALVRAGLADPDPDLWVVRHAGPDVPAGAALPCSDRACARPATDWPAVRAGVAMLRAAARG